MSRAATVTKPAWPGKSAHTLVTVQVLDRRTRSWIGNAVPDSLVTYPAPIPALSHDVATAHLTDPHHNSWDRHQQHDESYNPDREPNYYIS